MVLDGPAPAEEDVGRSDGGLGDELEVELLGLDDWSRNHWRRRRLLLLLLHC